MAKTTWRFEFVDINRSITINETESNWIGYAVIRAPKGTTEAMYIPPNNKDRIEAMFGYASADWPDIYEVIDFNNEYGLYISAPTVDVKEFPNYYGGVYFTSKGVLPLYRFSSKTDPNYEVGIVPGSEVSMFGTSKSSTCTLLGGLNKPGEEAVIEIKGIPNEIFKHVKYLDFDWKPMKGTYRYRIDKAAKAIFPADTSVSDSAHTAYACGSIKNDAVNQTWTIYLGSKENTNGNTADQSSNSSLTWKPGSQIEDVPFIDFNEYSAKPGYRYEDLFDDWATFKASNDAAELESAIASGEQVTIGEDGYKVKYEKPLAELFHLVYDIKDDTYAYIVQPSATAQVTSISIDSVGYDKYVYDQKLYYYSGASTSSTKIADVIPKDDKTLEKVSLNDNLLIVEDTAKKTVKLMQWVAEELEVEDIELEEDTSYTLVNGDTTSTVTEATFADFVSEHDLLGGVDYTLRGIKITLTETGIAKVNGETVTYGSWEDVTEDYETQKLLAFNPVNGKVVDTINHRIFLALEGSLLEMAADAVDEELKLQENVWFNSFHSKAVEEDSEGNLHTSGDLTGSLDEFGVDENNADNYWEELLPPGESVCYAEVYVVRTFDKEVDEYGIYKGTRIDEEVGVTRNVSGQRYVDYVVEKNIAAGYTGGNCTDTTPAIQKKFCKIIKEGLIEAKKPKYADVSLFMEFTGLDDIKTYFTGISVTHYCSTSIMPKNLNINLFNNTKKITVVNRRRNTAQYVQELQYKDKNLRKKYYSCPIGAVGVMLMRIMEGYYGGVAPAWINEGDVGGQLEGIMLRVPEKARWDLTDADTKVLDEKGLNPILMDVDDGVMIVSQRTTEQNAGDWSYLGHSMAFNLCKKEIRDNVMKPQLMKKISPYWMNRRQEDTDKILLKRTSGADPIWSYAKCEITSVNNDYTRAQRIFNIYVEVRVFPFSEKVRLTFKNLGQNTQVSD